MATNKPRNSVLYLFDPLSTPRRDSSPESSSDKENENDAPPGELTVFFNRTYKVPAHAMPKTPQGCLIDFNATMDEAWDADIAMEDDENENSSKDFGGDGEDPSDTALRSPSANRRPLADIDLDATPRPRVVSTQPPVPVHTMALQDTAASPPVSPAPATSPLAEVINSINLSAMTISLPGHLAARTFTTEKAHEPVDADIDATFPRIIVCSPPPSEPELSGHLTRISTVDASEKVYGRNEAHVDAAFPQITVYPPTVSDQSAPVSPTSAASLAPSPRRRLSLNIVPADDPRRGSVDLQASFSMQMHSPEMSFDLLNDKISFVGQDSIWAGADDEDFDMEAEVERMEAAADECERAEREAKVSSAAQARSSAVIPSACRPFTPQCQIQLPQPSALEENTAVHQSMMKPSLNQESLNCVAPPFLIEPEAAEAHAVPIPTEIPFAAYRRASVESPAATPVASVPSVPALRIVKKTWKVHGRAESTASTESSLSSSGSSTGSSSSVTSFHVLKTDTRVFSTTDRSGKVEAAPQNAHVPAPARTVIQAVQRPAVPATLSGTSALLSRATAQAPSNAAAEEAARRFAAAGIQRPNLQLPVQVAPLQTQRLRSDQRTQVGVGLAPRAQRSTSTVLTTTRAASGGMSKASGSSLLRAPSRYGSVGAAAGASALPRPASRLPAPSSTSWGGVLRGREAKTMGGPPSRVVPGARRAF